MASGIIQLVASMVTDTRSREQTLCCLPWNEKSNDLGQALATVAYPDYDAVSTTVMEAIGGLDFG